MSAVPLHPENPPTLDATTVARAFEVMLPASDDNLSLERNPHKGFVNPAETEWDDDEPEYMPVAEYLKRNQRHIEFTGQLEQQKIEATDSLWQLEWTLVGKLEPTIICAAPLPAIAQWLQDQGLAFGS